MMLKLLAKKISDFIFNERVIYIFLQTHLIQMMQSSL